MRFMTSVLGILAVALLAIGCQNTTPPATVQKATTPANASTPLPTLKEEHDHDDGAPRITLAEAKKAFDAGNVVFVDTRAANTFQQEHIKGAINIPAEAAAQRYNEIPKGKKIIAYCS